MLGEQSNKARHRHTANIQLAIQTPHSLHATVSSIFNQHSESEIQQHCANDLGLIKRMLHVQAMEHRDSALKLMEHWKKEAERQAQFAQVRDCRCADHEQLILKMMNTEVIDLASR